MTMKKMTVLIAVFVALASIAGCNTTGKTSLDFPGKYYGPEAPVNTHRLHLVYKVWSGFHEQSRLAKNERAKLAALAETEEKMRFLLGLWPWDDPENFGLYWGDDPKTASCYRPNQRLGLILYDQAEILKRQGNTQGAKEKYQESLIYLEKSLNCDKKHHCPPSKITLGAIEAIKAAAV
ncbi:hypothetical protein HYZ76_01020 [Candidatus Falkowbacteria bacterium]|nr:hypothetical protein [Candidatus Falkowbacteria bacterium]